MKWFGGTIILIMVQQNHSEGLRNSFMVPKSNITIPVCMVATVTRNAGPVVLLNQGV